MNTVLHHRDLYLEGILPSLDKETMRSSSCLSASLFENLDKDLLQKIEQSRKQDLIMKAVQATPKPAPAADPVVKKTRTQKRPLKFTNTKGQETHPEQTQEGRFWSRQEAVKTL